MSVHVCCIAGGTALPAGSAMALGDGSAGAALRTQCPAPPPQLPHALRAPERGPAPGAFPSPAAGALTGRDPLPPPAGPSPGGPAASGSGTAGRRTRSAAGRPCPALPTHGPASRPRHLGCPPAVPARGSCAARPPLGALRGRARALPSR